MESPPLPPPKSRYSAPLVDFFLLQVGCGVVFLLPAWLSGIGALFGFFLGGYLVMEDIYTKLDGYAESELSDRNRMLLLRLVSFLIGTFFGGQLSTAFFVSMAVSGLGRELTWAGQLATLICLVSGVIAGSLVFVGRKLHRLPRRLCFWMKFCFWMK